MSGTTDLNSVLDIIGVSDENIQMINDGGFMRLSHLRTLDPSTLGETLTLIGVPLGTKSQVCALAAWYKQWRETPADTKLPLDEAFTEDAWETFLDNFVPDNPNPNVSNNIPHSQLTSPPNSVIVG